MALLVLQMTTEWSQLSGAWWRRRWSAPHEAVHGFMRFDDGRLTDWVLGPNDWQREVDDWRAGRMPFMGELLDAEWLNNEASAHAHMTVLGELRS